MLTNVTSVTKHALFRPSRKDYSPAMAVESFPVEAGHVLMFARSIGDPNPVYSDPEQPRPPKSAGSSPRRRSCRPAPSSTPTTGSGPASAGPGSGRAGTRRACSAPRPAEGGERRRRPAEGGERRRRRRSGGGGGSGLHAEQHYTYHRPVRVGRRAHRHHHPGQALGEAGPPGRRARVRRDDHRVPRPGGRAGGHRPRRRPCAPSGPVQQRRLRRQAEMPLHADELDRGPDVLGRRRRGPDPHPDRPVRRRLRRLQPAAHRRGVRHQGGRLPQRVRPRHAHHGHDRPHAHRPGGRRAAH